MEKLNINLSIKTFGFIIIFLIITTTVAYASLNSSLMISGEAAFKKIKTCDQENINIDLHDEMIPIKRDGSKWVKANSENYNNDWYDYCEHKWANIVLVTEDNRERYQQAPLETIIDEDDVLAYYVWIPRYSYELFNINKNGDTEIEEKEIQIHFEKSTDLKNISSINGQLLTHPAFSFGDVELNGFWIGKYENSPDPKSLCYEENSAINCNVTNININIKPDLYSWNNQNVNNMFKVINNMNIDNNIYGLNNNLNSHMIKNMEWGAVAYLSQSMYGIYKNQTTEKSTSGTIYGVYNMNDNNIEYVMGTMHSEDNSFITNNSGFEIPPLINYYNIYTYSSENTNDYIRGHLGDATKEIVGSVSKYETWDGFEAFVPNEENNWIIRGDGSIFSFKIADGNFNHNYTSRAVLIKIKEI